MLSLASEHVKLLHAKATYKLVRFGYPVLIIGVSDMDKVFHPLGLTLCKDEKSNDWEFIFRALKIGIERCGFKQLEKADLMAEAADLYQTAFKEFFFIKLIFCLFYQRQN